MNTAVDAVPERAAQTVICSDTADGLVKEIGIPPCPAVLAEFTLESNRDEPDLRRLSHLVNKDVALAAAVLKTINSPYYGLSKKARTVQDALALLGLRQTGRLIAGLLLRRAFASFESPAMHAYWDESSRIAMVGTYLARELAVAVRLDEAHTFGLFRDCGVPVMLMRYPDYEQLLTGTRCESELVRAESERSRYGFDHALVGATLAQSWHLPTEIWQAIRAHNGYAEPGFLAEPRNARYAPLLALGLLAERLYRIHRGVYDAQRLATEEAFLSEVLGPLDERLEPLAGDIARILEQS